MATEAKNSDSLGTSSMGRLELEPAGLRFEFPRWRHWLLLLLLSLGFLAYVTGKATSNPVADVSVGVLAIVTVAVTFVFNLHLHLLLVVLTSTQPLLISLTLVQYTMAELWSPARKREGYYTLAHVLVTLTIISLDATKTQSRGLKVRCGQAEVDRGPPLASQPDSLRALRPQMFGIFWTIAVRLLAIVSATLLEDDEVLFEVADRKWTRNALRRSALLNSILLMIPVRGCPGTHPPMSQCSSKSMLRRLRLPLSETPPETQCCSSLRECDARRSSSAMRRLWMLLTACCSGATVCSLPSAVRWRRCRGATMQRKPWAWRFITIHAGSCSSSWTGFAGGSGERGRSDHWSWSPHVHRCTTPICESCLLDGNGMELHRQEEHRGHGKRRELKANWKQQGHIPCRIAVVAWL